MLLIDKALKGVKWTSSATIILTLVQLTQILILARFVTPAEYGVLAALLVIVTFAQSFVDLGLNNAIIQKQGIQSSQLSSLYWLNLIAGTTLSIALVFASSFLASFFAQPKLYSLIILVAPTLLITAIGAQYRALYQKSLQFDLLALVDVISVSLGLAILLFFLFRGAGIKSYIYSLLVQTTLASLVLLVKGGRDHYRPSLSFSLRPIAGLIQFGLYEMGNRSVNTLSINIDKILIAKLIGAEALGYYNLAWQLIIFPSTKINPIVDRVAFPIYSRLQENKALLTTYYLRSLKVMSSLTIPLLIFLSQFSDQIVSTIAGDGWSTTADIVEVLAYVGILRAVANPGGSLMLSLGRADLCFLWNVFWSFVLLVVLWGVLIIAPSTMAVPYTLLLTTLTAGSIWHFLIFRESGANVLKLTSSFSITILASLGLTYILRLSIDHTRLESVILETVVLSVVFAVIAVPVILRSFKKDIKYLKSSEVMQK